MLTDDDQVYLVSPVLIDKFNTKSTGIQNHLWVTSSRLVQDM